MRKLKLQVNVSVDGFIAGVNGEMDWMVWDWDDESKDYVWNLHKPVDTILLGRKLAEGFIDFWTTKLQEEPEKFAQKMVETPKIVFSKTLEKVEWKNTELQRGDLKEEITKLKNEEGGDIIVYGGAGFVSSLVKNNLIDEYYLLVNPAAIGKGMTIFAGLEETLKLRLINAKAFSTGQVVLQYEPNRE